ncbi:hypothetical protein GPL21_26950 [Bradyrhizobium pachyrhizi]|uniref:Uncharacterized protein n=1 Tax=Bradyrhizobium pachyrhizi TaxID=280333 RepID=A0A844SZK6_9BRAD|nr:MULTISPECIES: hypothetical protein [Bradyrhizobium]MVT68742.1 hypothetical protein [Bradyrhizobium pachyrhizi]
MSINAARRHTILIADAAVSVVNVACTAWRLYVRANRATGDFDQERRAQWPTSSVFDGLMRSAQFRCDD